jgi:prepilin peptidase CpaA
MPDLFANAAPLTVILSLTFPLVMAAAMISDVRQFRIPNSYSLVLAGIYPFAAWSGGLAGQVILLSLAAGVVVLLVGIGLFALNLFGGGDVKLLAAATLWTGLPLLLNFVLYTALLGGALALVILIFRKLPLAERLPLAFLRRQHRETNDIPYAVAIGIAGFIVFPSLPILTPG